MLITMVLGSRTTLKQISQPVFHTSLDISIDELEASVRGVEFPARKRELLTQAEHNRATGDMLAFLRLLPEGKYFQFNDVERIAWSFLLI